MDIGCVSGHILVKWTANGLYDLVLKRAIFLSGLENFVKSSWERRQNSVRCFKITQNYEFYVITIVYN